VLRGLSLGCVTPLWRRASGLASALGAGGGIVSGRAATIAFRSIGLYWKPAFLPAAISRSHNAGCAFL